MVQISQESDEACQISVHRIYSVREPIGRSTSLRCSDDYGMQMTELQANKGSISGGGDSYGSISLQFL